MKDPIRSHYAVRWVAIGALALTAVMLIPPFSRAANPLASTAGVLFAGVLDLFVFALLRRTVVANPRRFDVMWLVSIATKFFVLGLGCAVAQVLLPGRSEGFMHATAIAFALFVVNGAMSLAPYFERQSPAAFGPRGASR